MAGDDDCHVGWLAEQDAELVRGEARVVRDGVVEAGERELEYDELVIATGSSPAIPSIDGLADGPYWTSRDAVWADGCPGEPRRARRRARRRRACAVLPAHGGERDDRGDERPAPLEARSGGRRAAAGALRGEGIEIRTEQRVSSVSRRDDGVRVSLDSGDPIEAARLLVATGRRPNVDGLGLGALGVEVTRRGITVDDRLRAADGVWAIGDVAGIGLLTHLGKYQARVAASNIAGIDRTADYRAVPAAVFTDPQVASVGTTEGDGVVTASFTIDGGGSRPTSARDAPAS